MSSIFNFGIGLQVDDQASDSIDSITGALTDLGNQTKSTGNFISNWLNTPLQDSENRFTTLTKLTQPYKEGLMKATGAVMGLTEAIKDSFDEAALEMGEQLSRLSTGLGGFDQKQKELERTVLATANATGRAADKLVEVGAALGQVGFDISQMGKDFGLVSDLAITFGVGADTAADFASAMSTLNLDVEETLNVAAGFQHKFQMPHLLEQAAEAGIFAAEAIRDFRTTVVGTGQEVVRSVLRTAGNIGKALGVRAVNAIQDAKAAFRTFAQETQTIQKVFVVLADDFGPLTNALFEAGLDLNNIRDLMAKGRKDPGAFAAEVRRLGEQMRVSFGDNAAERFFIQISEGVDDTTRLLINNDTSFRQWFDAQKEASKRGTVSFRELTGEMRNTGAEALRIFDNLIKLGKAIIGLTFKDDAKEIFGGASNFLKRLNDQILALRDRLEDPTNFFNTKLRPAINAVLKVVVALGGAASALIGLKGGFGLLTLGMQAFNKVGARFNIIGGTKMGKIFGLLFQGAKKLLLPISIITSVSAGLRELGQVFRDPRATGVDKFEALIRGIGKTIDTFLLGIPSTLIKAVFPEIDATFSSGFLKNIGASIMKALSAAKEMFIRWGRNLVNAIPSFLPMIKEWGKDIGAGIGGLSQLIVEGFKQIFKFIGNLWTSFWSDSATTTADGGSEISSLLIDLLAGAWDVVVSLASGIWEGFLNSFGTSSKEMALEFQDLWGGVSTWFQNIWLKVKTFVLDVFDGFRIGWATASGYLVNGLIALWAEFQDRFTAAKFAWQVVLYKMTDAFLMFGSRVKAFWGDVIDQVKFGVFSLASAFFSSIAGVISKLEKVASGLGLTSLSKQLATARGAIDSMGKASNDAAAQAMKDAQARGAALKLEEAARNKAREAAISKLKMEEMINREHVKSVQDQVSKQVEADKKAIVASSLARKQAAESEIEANNKKRAIQKEQISNQMIQAIQLRKSEEKAYTKRIDHEKALAKAKKKTRNVGKEEIKDAQKAAKLSLAANQQWIEANRKAEDAIRSARDQAIRQGLSPAEVKRAVEKETINQIGTLAAVQKQLLAGKTPAQASKAANPGSPEASSRPPGPANAAVGATTAPPRTVPAAAAPSAASAGARAGRVDLQTIHSDLMALKDIMAVVAQNSVNGQIVDVRVKLDKGLVEDRKSRAVRIFKEAMPGG